MVNVNPVILNWYIEREEQNKNEPWWPLFIESLKTGNRIDELVDAIHNNLFSDIGVAVFQTGEVVSVDLTNRKFAEAVVEGFKKHFIKEEKVE